MRTKLTEQDRAAAAVCNLARLRLCARWVSGNLRGEVSSVGKYILLVTWMHGSMQQNLDIAYGGSAANADIDD